MLSMRKKQQNFKKILRLNKSMETTQCCLIASHFFNLFFHAKFGGLILLFYCLHLHDCLLFFVLEVFAICGLIELGWLELSVFYNINSIDSSQRSYLFTLFIPFLCLSLLKFSFSLFQISELCRNDDSGRICLFVEPFKIFYDMLDILL